ncbi:MAG: histidine kinase dimerization/phosphoacceptor domain -containing protein [Myxococcota bacterium]
MHHPQGVERGIPSQHFRDALEAAPTGMLMVDATGRIVLVNAQIERLFGYARAELIGSPLEMLVPERFRGRHPGFRDGFFVAPAARPMGGGRDLYGLTKGGDEVPIEIGLNPLETPDGRFVLSSVANITERKRAERERNDLNAQLKVLLQEVHHRVKNNLQIISSLLNMQIRQVSDQDGRIALEDCRRRVEAIGLIHEKLYQSQDYSRVPFSDYVRGLAENVYEALGATINQVRLELEIESMSMAVDRAIPCGLLLNELITNAIRHAFPGRRPGLVRVALRRADPTRVELVVEDDGVGMPEGFDVQKSNSLGMQLVHTLVEQVHADLEICHEHGTRFQIRLLVEEGLG